MTSYPYLYRKYIDLIQQRTSKYVSWDPLKEIRVGSYGTMDTETTEFHVEGNVYDLKFQAELDKHNIKLKLSDYPPEEGPIEEDMIIATSGAKLHGELEPEDPINEQWRLAERYGFGLGGGMRAYHPMPPPPRVSKHPDVPQIPGAVIQARWTFQRRDQRQAILILHKPRELFFPRNVVLEELYKVDSLMEKPLITSIYVCPAYSYYLSDKATISNVNTVTIALINKQANAGTTISVGGSEGNLAWWLDPSETGLFRHDCDQASNFAFTPLYTVKRAIKRIRRNFVGMIQPDPTGDELWYYESPSWEPLDDDGEEDPLDPDIGYVDPFETVNELARQKAEREAEAAAAAAATAAAESATATNATDKTEE